MKFLAICLGFLRFSVWNNFRCIEEGQRALMCAPLSFPTVNILCLNLAHPAKPKKPDIGTILSLKMKLYSDPAHFSIYTSVLFQDPDQDPILHLALLQSDNSSIFCDLDTSKELWSGIYKSTTQSGSVWCFLRITVRYFWKCIISGVCDINRT